MAEITADDLKKLEKGLKEDYKKCVGEECSKLKKELDEVKEKLKEYEDLDDKIKGCVGDHCKETIPKEIDEWHTRKWEEQAELERQRREQMRSNQDDEDEEEDDDEEDEEDDEDEDVDNGYCEDCSLETDHNVRYGEEGCPHNPYLVGE